MRNHEIENWALSIVDRVLAGQPIEDVRVELKSTWIDAKKAARRIAGIMQPCFCKFAPHEKPVQVTGK